MSKTDTIDENEISHFKNLKDNWWNEMGIMKPLHSMNTLRIPMIRDGILHHKQISPTCPLKDLHILDVGCGGKFHTTSQMIFFLN